MANLSNINNKFLVTTGGNVLIGQTAAVGSSILQVTGNATFAGDVTIADYIYHAGDGDTYIGFPAANEFKLVAGGNNIIAGDVNSAYLYFQGSSKLQTTSTGVSVTGGVNASSTSTFLGNGAAAIKFGNTSTLVTMSYSGTTGVIRGESGSALQFDTNGVNTALTLDTSQNATFAGSVTGTSANFSGIVYSGGFRNSSTNSSYNLFTRNNTGNTIFVQAAQSNANQPIAKFSYGSATVNAGTAVLQVSKDNSHFTNCDVGIGTTTPGSTLTLGNDTGNVAELRVLRSNSLSTTYGFINTVGGTAQLGGSGDTRIIASTGRLLFNSNSTDQISLEANGEYRLKLGSTTTGYEASMANDNTAYQIFGSRFGGTGKYVAIWSDGANENTRFYPTKTVFYKNVGIGTGTTSPSQALDVNGFIKAANAGANYVQGVFVAHSSTSDTPSYRGQGYFTYNEGYDVSWFMGTPYTNGDFFCINRQHSTTSFDTAAAYIGNTNTDNFFSITNTGNVGIGTTGPVSKLEVQSSLNSTNFTGITVTNTEGGGSNLSRAGIAFKAYDWVQSAIWHGRNMGDGNQGALVLGTNPNTTDLTVGGVVGRMYIINNGNVGIGNTIPRDKLTVFTAGTAEEEIALRLVNPVGFTNGGSGASIIFAQDRSVGENLPMAKIRSSQSIAGTSSYGDLIFSTLSSTMQDRMTIRSGGGVECVDYLKAKYFFSKNGSFSTTAGTWTNVIELQQSEFENRTVLCSVYTNGTHSYASATVNCAWNGGSFVLTLGNKIVSGSTDLRISSGYLQFYTPWTSTTNFYRLTVN